MSRVFFVLAEGPLALLPAVCLARCAHSSVVAVFNVIGIFVV